MKTLGIDFAEDFRHVTARASTTGLAAGHKVGGNAHLSIAAGTVLGRKSSMIVRLAANRDEIKASQRLRYRVFYEELSAHADEATRMSGRDQDSFDEICDHLLVVDGNVSETDDSRLLLADGGLVGTYRLLRQEVAEANDGFYTADEFDIAPLIASRRCDQRFLELGRSCVLKPYRTKPTVELLWQGIWNYIRLHGLDVMFGCASLEGTDPDALALPLSFLHHTALAPEEWRVRALPEHYIDMNRIPAEEIDMRAAIQALPPLIKGYLRLGAFVGQGAVIDPQFNTTDVLIVLPVSAINERYASHFASQSGIPE